LSRVHQILSSAGPYDAVSVQAGLWRTLLSSAGYGGADHAAAIDPRAAAGFKPLAELAPEPGDLLVIRYSAYSPRLLPLLERPERKLLIYHNVTPPGYFWNHHPGVAVACAVGRAQLPLFAAAADVCAADSAFNARDLSEAGVADPQVLPILFDPDRLGARGRLPGGDGPLVLVVSRLAPNKRHDLAIAAYGAWRREHGGAGRLLLVGEAVSPAYETQIRRLAGELPRGAVTLAGGLEQPDLNAAYASADLVLSMSEHEGFSIPLLEAFHFGVPVLARPAGAMPEVGGDAVLWDRGDDLAETAELIDLGLTEPALRGELVARGRRRLEAFAHAPTGDQVLQIVQDALA